MTTRDSLAFGSSDNDAILSGSGKINPIIAHSRGKEYFQIWKLGEE